MSTLLNWKDAEAYKFVLDASDSDRSWEFLRRSKWYRKGWIDFKASIAELESKFGPFDSWYSKSKKLEDYPELWFFGPPRNGDESVSSWKKRTREDPGRIRRLLPDNFARGWMLERPCDPFHSTTAIFRSAPQPLLRFTAEQLFNESLHVPDYLGSYAYVRIELEYDLDDQLARLKPRLVRKQEALLKDNAFGLQPTRPKDYRSLWPTYLQLLDADNDGASIPDMVPWIGTGSDLPPDFPKRKKLRKNLQAARSIADLQYRYWLPSLDEPEKEMY